MTKINEPKSTTQLTDELIDSFQFKKPEEEVTPESFATDVSRRRRGVERNRDVRTSEMKPVLEYDFLFGSQFTIPQVVKDADPDYVYGFTAAVINNERLDDVIESALDKGWYPVSRHDNDILQRTYRTLTPRDKDTDYIKKRGQIMMKRRSDMHEAEHRTFQKAQLQADEMRNNYIDRDHSISPQAGPMQSMYQRNSRGLNQMRY
jgi:hypothetical protein